jgi:hypothetical protein
MPLVTVEEILAVLNGDVGRPRVVADALLRIMGETLPGVLEELGLPLPLGFHWAGEEVPQLPAVEVSMAVTTEEHGGGHTDAVTAQIGWIAPNPLSRSDWQSALDAATVIRGLLYMPQFRGALRADTGQTLWHYTVPAGISPITPGQDMQYGGYALQLDVTQHGSKAGLNTLWVLDGPWKPTDVTPSADPAEVVEYMNCLCGRPRLVVDGILHVLEDSLPQMLAAFGLPEINGYLWAGEELTDSVLPAVVVACSTRCVPAGTHFMDQIHATVSIITRAPVSRKDRALAMEIASVVRAVLYTGALHGPFRPVEGGPHWWHYLHPTGLNPLPQVPDFRYGGYTLHFEAQQNPAGVSFDNLWQ